MFNCVYIFLRKMNILAEPKRQNLGVCPSGLIERVHHKSLDVRRGFRIHVKKPARRLAMIIGD